MFGLHNFFGVNTMCLYEYTVALFKWLPNGEKHYLDETSVDADFEAEALDVALDLFKEWHPKENLTVDNLEVVEWSDILPEDREDITVGVD